VVSFSELWESLLPIGRDATTGGYHRYSFTDADAACRQWFLRAAAERGLRAYPDRNGNLWAWWDSGSGKAVATGSHLDSVPDGGGYDGALGVVSAFAAVDLLRERGFVPRRPIAVAAFCEEEGARFGVACLGSRLATGAIDPATARDLSDADGVSLAEAMRAAGLDPAGIGADDELLSSLGEFVELHIEQGRQLGEAPLGVATGIWAHGRWRLDFTGRADHAGTTRFADRRDPMIPFAVTVLAARSAASTGLATFGKVVPESAGANAICPAVHAWLDVRAPAEGLPDRIAEEALAAARTSADLHGVELSVRRESYSPAVTFDEALRDRIGAVLSRAVTWPEGLAGPPKFDTGAGHDAAVLAARIPAGMIFVRNPTGISHSPAEQAEPADCEAGVTGLAAVLEDLASR
jgi:N-carbamoyl-L-amino-acid hydrolase